MNFDLVAEWVWYAGAGWLVKYYGATPAVQSHWDSIKLYMDGQLATAGADGLPDFWTWGDWCAVQDRAKCTPGTGESNTL